MLVEDTQRDKGTLPTPTSSHYKWIQELKTQVLNSQILSYKILIITLMTMI